jgi:hypothetical protein
MQVMARARGQFIEQLDRKRQALTLDNATFAAYLTERGVPTSPSKWSRLRHGKLQPRLPWARAACRVWPDLAVSMAADLLTHDGGDAAAS